MKVKLKKVDEKAQLPTKGKVGDLCYDVWAVDEEEIAPNVWRYKLGFKYEIVREPIKVNDGFDDKYIYLPYKIGRAHV